PHPFRRAPLVSSPCNFRSESLLVAFYLLTSAVTAYAECAWVPGSHLPLRCGARGIRTALVNREGDGSRRPCVGGVAVGPVGGVASAPDPDPDGEVRIGRSEEHTSELQSPCNLVCRLLLEKKKTTKIKYTTAEIDTCTVGSLRY